MYQQSNDIVGSDYKHGPIYNRNCIFLHYHKCNLKCRLQIVAIFVGLDVMWDDMACQTAITKEEPKWVIELTEDTEYLVLMGGLWVSFVSIWRKLAVI